MVKEIKRHISASPFRSFTLIMSSGQRYNVPTANHAGLSPTGSQAVIWFNDGSSVMLSTLHMTAIETEGDMGQTVRV
jgi:hypothetical protein